MIPTPNLSCPIDTIRGTGAREFSGLGINSQPKDFGLEADPGYEKELRKQNPKDDEYQAKLVEYHNRLTEDYRAKLEEYHLKVAAHIILADIVGQPIEEIQRALNEHNVMLSYRNLDEMILRWRKAQAEGWPDDLRERLSGITQCAPGSLRDRRNDVECTLLNGRKKAISLDKLVESGAPWYGSVDTSPDEALYRSQYGEWFLVFESINWGTGQCSTEARELTPAQAHAWFWENQINLPDSLKGINLHDMDPSEKKGSDLTSAEKAVPIMTGPGTPTSPASIEVFYSYAHEDEELVKQLRKHLSLLKRQGVIREWYDREITAGTEWKGQIDQHLNAAGVILLLISADFLASDYCYDVEMTRALERHEQGEARVIPVLLRKVDGWQGAPFGKLQSLPTDGKPVTSWNDRDEAFADVARGIRRAVSELTVFQPKSSSWPASQPTVLPAPSPQRTPAMDRPTLVKTLTGLDPSDLSTVIALISGARNHVSRQGTVREQAGELIGWAESSTGPGLAAIEEALRALRSP